ncbi:MAG: XRE family transcriptional regulator [Clostridium perfringens]|uniref:helix-turn-helix domain-containing protein n=1 Tax=Clostridium TaxID=1485 RepID=UPI0013E2926D|nr:XRE family transcriptional regulator [Clostridium perfringens]ELC8354482.1 XRE family transcriptional regulator [Clostridium perfringens]MDK0838058.1 XRE family transcriptional regulator [Clostridium perfringens]MDK0906723.1 XRE family transcriptional regulator [Clostridium perfringens]MDM0760855.1 XRE family transcriptional regulator [Clostridium perfringens]MDU2779901.1 XRE family transcriptional regulator [Clostridium perfringens]
MKEKYYKIVTDFEFSEEEYIENIEIFIEVHFPIVLDEGYLSPEHFKTFCGLFMIPYTFISDEYYLFVLSDYAKTIYDNRKELNYTQKDLAHECNISPVDIYKFESYLKYPTRAQFKKLKKHKLI